MIQREKEREKTDRAWSKLYSRLDDEGLFAEQKPKAFHRPIAWKWASAVASVVVLCVCFSVFYFPVTEQSKASPLLTQQNEESTTLVTTLEDGSVVYLAQMTSLHYPEHFSPDRREVSLSGNALFDITGNRARPFLIETEEAVIEVLGTAFDVRSDGSAPFELSVRRGEVKVTLKKSGQNVHVKAGETVKLLSQKWYLSATRDHQLFDRYTQIMRFKDERVADIIRVINMQEQGGVLLQTSAAIGERVLTFTFSDNSPEAVAELICLALNLKCTREKEVLTLTE